MATRGEVCPTIHSRQAAGAIKFLTISAFARLSLWKTNQKRIYAILISFSSNSIRYTWHQLALALLICWFWLQVTSSASLPHDCAVAGNNSVCKHRQDTPALVALAYGEHAPKWNPRHLNKAGAGVSHRLAKASLTFERKQTKSGRAEPSFTISEYLSNFVVFCIGSNDQLRNQSKVPSNSARNFQSVYNHLHYIFLLCDGARIFHRPCTVPITPAVSKLT